MEKNKIPYIIFKGLLGFLFTIYYRPKYVNKEVIPQEGAIIVCGNHVHLYDQCLSILASKRMLHYMAKKEYFEGKMAWFFKIVGCISVDRENKDVIAKEKALKILNSGLALGIFPEGTRNKTKEILQPFKYGTVSMAQKSDATIVPFGITGKYKFFKNNLTITFGTPFKVGNMTLEEANKKLYNEVYNIIKQ